MNHSPYEEWLLAEDPLDPAHQSELAAHLAECPECRDLAAAFSSLTAALKAAPQAIPEPGFSARWQTRQAHRRIARQRRQIWIVLLTCGAGALAALVGLALPQVGGLPSAVSLLSSLLRTISQLSVSLQSIREVGGLILENIPLGVPLLLWIVGSTIVAIWCLVWLAAIWQLPKMRRSHNEITN